MTTVRVIAVGALAALLAGTLRAAAQPAAAEVVVRGLPLQRDAFEIKESASFARQAPGTQGDPLKLVESLPGVARAGLGSDSVVLWGAAPEDTRSLVDGVEVPYLFHYGGVRSVLNADLIQSIALTPGAFGVDVGRAIGGALRVATRELPQDTWHALLDVNALDAAAFVSAKLGQRLRFAVAGRVGWIERLFSAVQRDNTTFFALPKYRDAQAKLEWELGAQQTLSLVVLAASDVITHASNSSGRLQNRRDGRGFERIYLRYSRNYDDGTTVTVTPWLGREHRELAADFSSTAATAAERSFALGLRAEHRSRLNQWFTLNLGTDLSSTRTSLARDGSLTIPAREGDANIFGQAPGADVNSDIWQSAVVDLAVYGGLDFRHGRLSLSPGLRFDGYLLETSRRTPRIGQTPAIGSSQFVPELQPRLQGAFKLSPRVSLLAAVGVYSQPPKAADLSSVFSSPTLGPELAQHVSLGESIALTSNLSLTTLGFFKAMEALAVRDASSTPKLAQALTQTGRGQSYGVQLTLRQRPWHGFSGAVAHTISRSERQVPGERPRLFDHDQPHVLSLTLEKALADWHFGIRLRGASGNPRTKVIGALFNEQTAAFEPIQGPQNTARLPTFWQLDARVDRAFTFKDAARLLLQLEVLNLTNHSNIEEYSYNADYTQQVGIRGLPLLAVLGARLEL